MPEMSALSVLPTCGTPEIVGVPVASITNTVELLTTSKSAKDSASLPSTSSMTSLPSVGAA